jgi:phage terminase small subunit
MGGRLFDQGGGACGRTDNENPVSEYEKMPIEALERLLSVKQKRFVEELDQDGNGTQAAIRSGFTPGKNNKSAAVAASRMLRNDKVLAYRHARAREIYKNLGISRETVSTKLIGIYNRCMQAEPYLEWDSEEHAYVQKGQFIFDAKNALKALELIGDSQGMFIQKTVNENYNMTVEEYLSKMDKSGKDYEY